MDRVRWRKVAWLLFALFLLGTFVAITVWIIHTALHAGPIERLLAAGGWVAAFAASWEAFRRSHGYRPTTQPPKRKISQRQERWGLLLAGGAVCILLSLNESTQMIGLALISGFMWPAFYWITRSFAKRPELRQRLWKGQLKQR